jgi:acyl-[acyl carrier protein]--UDP-N-acetylglucosamine O-acyltransferase
MNVPYPFYSNRTMSLSAVSALFPSKVLRDGTFENIGMFRNSGRNMLTVFYADEFRPQLDENIARFSAVVTTAEFADRVPPQLAVLVSDNPLELFLRLHIHLAEKDPEFYTLEQPSVVSSSALIHPSAIIDKVNVVIEAGTVIDAGVVIKSNTYIGRNCYIAPGVVISAAGFEMRNLDGKLTYIPHVGGVAIGNDVHILANCGIARSLFGGATTIGDGCKFDQFVHVAHAVVVGRNCRLAACCCISGSTELGENVWVGPNAVIGNSLRIGDKAWVAIGSVVARDVAAGIRVGGGRARQI